MVDGFFAGWVAWTGQWLAGPLTVGADSSEIVRKGTAYTYSV